MARSLAQNQYVRSIDFRGCNIHAAGCVAIAELIEENSNITALGLEWNSVGNDEDGITALAKALLYNKGVTELDLRNNSIGPSGATAFGQMLSTNTGLRRVDLRWNAMGPGGVEVLCAGLQKNTQISELLVAGNKATDDSKNQAHEARPQQNALAEIPALEPEVAAVD